jgi:WD40 repeat protein
MAAGLEGIFTPGVSEKDVTCCQISPINEAKRKRTIIVGDNYSQLKLYNYPTFHQGVFNRYKGHSSYVSAVRFTEDEKYVVSVGGQEKAILLWKYDPTVVENKF